MLAWPHVLTMLVILAWSTALVFTTDRSGVPSLWMLPLITLWGNLHGGFVFRIALIPPLVLDEVMSAERPHRLAIFAALRAVWRSRARCRMTQALRLGFDTGVTRDPIARRGAERDR